MNKGTLVTALLVIKLQLANFITGSPGSLSVSRNITRLNIENIWGEVYAKLRHHMFTIFPHMLRDTHTLSLGYLWFHSLSSRLQRVQSTARGWSIHGVNTTPAQPVAIVCSDILRQRKLNFLLILIVKGLMDGTRRKKKYALKWNPNGLEKRIWGYTKKNEIVLTSIMYWKIFQPWSLNERRR